MVARVRWLTAVLFLASTVVVCPILANTTLRDDLVIGFDQPYGIYQHFDGLTWSQLHPLTPRQIVAADLNLTGRSDLIIDFGSPIGMWVRRDDTAWEAFHPGSPDQYVAADLDFNGRDEIIADFGVSGLWIRYNDDHWSLLHSGNATRIAVAQIDDDLRDDLVVAFPGEGIWIYANNSEWRQLHGINPINIEAGRFCGDRDGVIIDFPNPHGIYLYCEDWYYWQLYPPAFEWLKLHAGTAEGIATGQLDYDGSPDEAVFDFGAAGTWILFNAQPGPGWSLLHPFSPRQMTVADLDSMGEGDIVLDFHALGIWAYHNLSVWVKKNPNSAATLATANTNRPLHTCLDLLVEGFIIEADDCIDALLIAESEDLRAHLFKSITSVLRVFSENPQVALPFDILGNGSGDFGMGPETLQTLLDAFGVADEDRNPLNFTADLPDPLLKGSPDGSDVQDAVRTQIVSALNSAINDHLGLIGPSFEVILDGTDLLDLDQPLDIDYADAKLLEAAFRLLKVALIKVLVAHDLDVDIAALNQQAFSGVPLQLQADILSPFPSLLTSNPDAAADLADAKSDLLTALDCYFTASDFMRNDDDPNQLDDLVTIDFDPVSLMEEEQLRRELGSFYCSIDGLGFADLDEFGFPECGGSPMIDGEAVNLSVLFDETNDLRSLLPTFQWSTACRDDYVDTSVIDTDTPFPDPTLGGLFPGQTQLELLENLDIPGAVRRDYEPQVFGTPGGNVQFFQSHVYQSELSPQISINAISYSPGSVFAVDAPTLPTLPHLVCSQDHVWFGSLFSPPGEGAFQESVILSTSIGNFTSRVLGCTGGFGDCNNDGAPDFSVRDLGKCTVEGQVVPSPGSGSPLVDPCNGAEYLDSDPGVGDGVLDDCNCDGFLDQYPDRGKCAPENVLLPSPGVGPGLIDPCTSLPYSDSDPGRGDGRVDDCDCDGWPDP